MEMLEEEFSMDGVPVRGGKLLRSHSWSYSTFRANKELAAKMGAGKERGCEVVSQKHVSASLDSVACPQRGIASPMSSRITGQASWASMLEEEEEELFAGASPDPSNASTAATPVAVESRDVKDFGLVASAPAPAAVLVPAQNAVGAQPPHPQGVTTYMVQNISRTLTRRGFMDALDAHGFEGHYDVVHLPKTFGSGRNKGFAFVNFLNPDVARLFAGRFAGADGRKVHDKVWRVAPADVQGFNANAAAANSRKMTRVRNNSCRPLIVEQHGLA